jgi:hypothetical protein
MRRVMRVWLIIAAVMAIPRFAVAQASIAGTVKDSSGAILPGVTVEASSPVLIEKTRAVVTDGTGQYKIVDLRPGTYTVTFTLTGFTSVKREGIELTGAFTATVNADLKVGAVEETITVTGETPIVDVQSATKERSLSAEVIASIPTGRSYFDLAVLVPGVSVSGNASAVGQDVGGSKGPTPAGLVIHGSHEDSQRITYNGISISTLLGTANRAISAINTSAYQEVTIDTGAASAELGQGGVRINLVPKDGGNTFHLTSFVNYANQSMQGSNYTDALKARGLTTPNPINRLWDINPGFGGPIEKDKLWYFVTLRDQRAENYVAGLFYNQNANNAASWTYVADSSRPVINKSDWLDGQARVTWQATPRNKIAGSYNAQSRKAFAPSTTTAPEATRPGVTPSYLVNADWTSTVTKRLLLEVVGMYHLEQLQILTPFLDPNIVSVTEQGGTIPGLTYRAPATSGYSQNAVYYYRAALSYVSGSHAVKIGWNDGSGWANTSTRAVIPYSYTFLNGTANRITMRSAPEGVMTRMDHDGGIFAQDRWTVKRLTVTYGIRYDYYADSFPAQYVGPSQLAPARNISFPETDGLHWKDLTPKFSATYDLFGNGRTALKGSVNKFVNGLGLGTTTAALNPAAGLATSTTRSWTDQNKNFTPDCDLLNPAVQDTRAAGGDFCGAWADPNFGKSVVAQAYDPNLVSGWNKRGYDWEFSAGVQQQILPKVSVDVSYFRRLFGNFIVQDNTALAASDFSTFSITAPSNPGLAGGGNYTINGLYDVNPTKFTTPAKWVLNLSDTYGNQIEHWNGVDFNVNARMGSVLAQGGFNTGKTATDNCAIVSQVPEFLSLAPSGFTSLTSVYSSSAWTPAQYCHVESPWLTQMKALASYRVPKIDVAVSGTFQSFPGPQIVGNYLVTNAVAGPSLQRSLAGNVQNITVNIVAPMSLYGDRINQLDLRFAKLIKLAGTRSNVSVDVYNALNANPVLSNNNNYTAFLTPTSIRAAGFANIRWLCVF